MWEVPLRDVQAPEENEPRLMRASFAARSRAGRGAGSRRVDAGLAEGKPYGFFFFGAPFAFGVTGLAC